MKKHNFYAGPSILPEFTIQKTAEAVINFAGTTLSVMEVSHRSKEFVAVMDQAIALVKELLAVPEGYEVLFLQGGASTQFYMAPYNLMKSKAGYMNTGVWATAAIKEGKFFGEVVEVASSKDKNYNYIVLENGKPTFFILYEHKTKKTYPEKKLTIPNKLVDILTQYIKSNDMVQGDYLFGVKNADFKIHVAQSNFTKMIQRIFKLYMGKKISVDLIRSSLSTYADSQNLSLGERKKIATDIHQLQE